MKGKDLFNQEMKTNARAKIRHLLIWWAAWSLLVFFMFAGFLFWYGVPGGPDGIMTTWIETISISLITPPIVWLIGKAVIG